MLRAQSPQVNVARQLQAWRVAQAIPGAKLVFFEHTGHLPSYEEPEKYVTVLEGFLNGREVGEAIGPKETPRYSRSAPLGASRG